MQTSMISGAAIDDEAQIVDDASKGNIAAQKALYSLHIRYLAGVCSRYILNTEDVKDVLQESFLKFSHLCRHSHIAAKARQGMDVPHCNK